MSPHERFTISLQQHAGVLVNTTHSTADYGPDKDLPWGVRRQTWAFQNRAQFNLHPKYKRALLFVRAVHMARPSVYPKSEVVIQNSADVSDGDQAEHELLPEPGPVDPHATIRDSPSVGGPARYVPSSSFTLGGLRGGGANGFEFEWSPDPLQLNLERHPEVVTDNSATPAAGTIEYWNGDRAVEMDKNWIDPDAYTLKFHDNVDWNGDMQVWTWGNPSTSETVPNIGWTITSPDAWKHTIMYGTRHHDEATDTTTLAVHADEDGHPIYRPFVPGAGMTPANPQEDFTRSMRTEVRAYTFPGKIPNEGTVFTPQLTASVTMPWHGLPAGLDAAVLHPGNSDLVMFFKNGFIYTYDVDKRRQADATRLVAEVFPQMAENATKIRGVFRATDPTIVIFNCNNGWIFEYKWNASTTKWECQEAYYDHDSQEEAATNRGASWRAQIWFDSRDGVNRVWYKAIGSSPDSGDEYVQYGPTTDVFSTLAEPVDCIFETKYTHLAYATVGGVMYELNIETKAVLDSYAYGGSMENRYHEAVSHIPLGEKYGGSAEDDPEGRNSIVGNMFVRAAAEVPVADGLELLGATVKGVELTSENVYRTPRINIDIDSVMPHNLEMALDTDRIDQVSHNSQRLCTFELRDTNVRMMHANPLTVREVADKFTGDPESKGVLIDNPFINGGQFYITLSVPTVHVDGWQSVVDGHTGATTLYPLKTDSYYTLGYNGGDVFTSTGVNPQTNGDLGRAGLEDSEWTIELDVQLLESDSIGAR